jgi:hypothetical protein
LVQALCAAPQEPAERARICAFYEERERRLRTRPEYPLLLAVTGVRRLRWSDFWVGGYAATTRADWQAYDRGRTLAGHDASAGMGLLESAFAWSDRLADHYGTAYRSGNILNFSFAALSVILALSGALIPHAKLWLASGELLLVSALVANTWIGTHREWHRRWLDYRYLAEQLRPMRSLRLLGLAQPPSLPARGGRQPAALDGVARLGHLARNGRPDRALPGFGRRSAGDPCGRTGDPFAGGLPPPPRAPDARP